MKVFAKVVVCLFLCSGTALAQPNSDNRLGDSRVDDPRRPPAASAEEGGPLSQWIGYKSKYGFSVVPWGYVRMSYEAVANDDDYDFVGRSDGFVLNNVRTGLDVALGSQFSARVSLEAATDVNEDLNSPFGEVDVRLRDGYLRWDPFFFLGIQAGQFKAPFAAEELRSTSALLFVDRAVGQDGVFVGRGLNQPGLAVDRHLGVMLSPREPLPLGGDFGLAYYLTVVNGNGDNQILNDNSKVAVIGRVEALFSDWVTLGAAGLWNKRTVGDPPNRYDEEDTGVAADLLINPFGLELFFQFVQFETDFQTTDVDERTQRALHVQAGYRFNTPWFHITPAYRFAFFDPWADGGGTIAGIDADAFELEYHTLGARLGHLDLPLALYLNYTFTVEQEPRELENNRFQILAQIEF